MQVVRYEKEMLDFICDKCGNFAQREISRLIKEEECALEIELVCPYCKEDRGLVYYLKCKDPTKALDLQARLDFLKIKQAAVNKNGDKKLISR
jgi:hypothetical protein